MAERSFPFTPKSSRDLRIGDYWVTSLDDGTLACFQVTDLKAAGAGALKTLVVGVIDWRGTAPPAPADLRSRRVLVQGLTRIEAFADGRNSQILGNCTDTVGADELPSNYRAGGVGSVHHVWGWRILPKVALDALKKSRPA